MTQRSGYSRLHSVRCGPDAIYVNALGPATHEDGAGWLLLLDHSTFDVVGPWETERNGQELASSFGRPLAKDVLVTSEWAKPHQFEDGIVVQDILAGKYGHCLHFWDTRGRKNIQTVDLGSKYQMPLVV